MRQPPETLQTERLLLRRGGLDDAVPLFEAYASDPQATKYLSWRTHESVFQTEEFLEEADARWDRDEEYTWIVVARANDRPIGGVSAVPGMHGVEIGYVLARPLWGSGLVVEAASAVMAWLRDRDDVYRIWAYCAVEHRRSAHVMERLGMPYEATLQRWITLPNFADEPCDALVHAWVRPGHC